MAAVNHRSSARKDKGPPFAGRPHASRRKQAYSAFIASTEIITSTSSET